MLGALVEELAAEEELGEAADGERVSIDAALEDELADKLALLDDSLEDASVLAQPARAATAMTAASMIASAVFAEAFDVFIVTSLSSFPLSTMLFNELPFATAIAISTMTTIATSAYSAAASMRPRSHSE